MILDRILTVKQTLVGSGSRRLVVSSGNWPMWFFGFGEGADRKSAVFWLWLFARKQCMGKMPGRGK